MVQSSTSPNTQSNGSAPAGSTLYRGVDLNVQQHLTQLEEIIFDSPHIPLTGITMVEEEKLLDQLDLVRASLPEVIEKAMEVLQQKAQLIVEAESYAEEIMAAAERRAAQMLDEMTILRQAEQNAEQLRQDSELECQTLKQNTMAEVEENRRRVLDEIQQMQQAAIAEASEIQRGADEYASSVLGSLEGQLQSMLSVVRNGRQQLQPSLMKKEGQAAEGKQARPQGNRKRG